MLTETGRPDGRPENMMPLHLLLLAQALKFHDCYARGPVSGMKELNRSETFRIIHSSKRQTRLTHRRQHSTDSLSAVTKSNPSEKTYTFNTLKRAFCVHTVHGSAPLSSEGRRGNSN